MNDGVGEGPQPTIFGLDYDNTYTRDPVLWGEFIRLARSRGHKVHCVSCRFDNLENRQEMDVPGVLTYLTSMSPKDRFMRERGIAVDVWIDDVPGSVDHGR